MNPKKNTSIEKAGRSLTPNMRALRLSLTIGETLLSMGISASSVTDIMLSVTDAYCERRVIVDITSTSLTVSQDRGIDHEPLTLVRNVSMREVNNLIVQDIETLVRDILKGLSLHDAEEQLKLLIDFPHSYSALLRTFCNAGISAGVVLMFTNSIVVIATTYGIGCIVDRIIFHMGRRGIPSFFIQVAASLFITLSAVVIASAGKHGMDPFVGISPTLIVVGGIVMLVAGLTVVATAQDAIDEFYVTASARALKTLMMTAGIVVGIAVGVYISKMIGQFVHVSADPIPMGDFRLQISGAVIISLLWAIYIQAKIPTIILAGIMGGLAWIIYSIGIYYGIAEAAAVGIGAIVIGFLSSIVSRVWKTPLTAILNAAIVPLVPGLGLFNGLMQIVMNAPGSAEFVVGLGTLFVAGSIALSIAAGVSLGNVIGRPLPRRLAKARQLILNRSKMRKY